MVTLLQMIGEKVIWRVFLVWQAVPLQCNVSNYSSAPGPRKQDVDEIQADDSDNEGADSFETQVTTRIKNHKGCDFELDKA